MIVDKALARAIVTGHKTQLRLPAIAGCPVKIGHDYSVQTARGRPAVCRVKVTARRRERVGDITHRDARSEGHRTTDDFKTHWVRRYDRAWIDRELIDLAAAFDDGTSVVDWILLRRFACRHAHAAVWVVTFAVQLDASRYLASQTDILAGSAQYTENRARAADDLEVVPDSWLQAQAARARAASDEQRERQRVERAAERQGRRNMRVFLLRAATSAAIGDMLRSSPDQIGSEHASCGATTLDGTAPSTCADRNARDLGGDPCHD